MTILYIALAIIGIGLIIFLHELGHFLAAKKVGVRVERFALGFDPKIRGRNLRLFSFRRGETEYVLGMIPFGGYVKMAGEIIPGQEYRPEADELLAKSVGARALVFAAGALMNIFSAFFLFMIAFTIGVPFVDTRLGSVVPGSSAWEAGLRAGDRIVEIDGKPAVDFSEVMLASVLSREGDSIRLVVERAVGGGAPARRVEMRVAPRWNPEVGARQIGVRSAIDPVLVGDPPPQSVAARAGLRKGDEIVGAELGGEVLPATLPREALLESIFLERIASPQRPLRLRVRRGGDERWVSLTPPPPSDAPLRPVVQVLGRAAGENFSGTTVRAIAPGSGAAELLEPGDRIVSVEGEKVGSVHWLVLLGKFPRDTLHLVVEKSGGGRREVDVPREELLSWAVAGEVLWVDRAARIASLEDGSPLRAAGLREGDVIASVDGEPVWTGAELERKLAGSAGRELELHRIRAGAWDVLHLSVPAEGMDAGAKWASFGPVADVTPDGPAWRAGLRPGCRLVSYGNQSLHSYREFFERVRETEPGTKVAAEWIDPSGEKKTGEIEVGARRPEDLGLSSVISTRSKIVQSGVLGSFRLGFQRTVNVGKQVFLTLASLLRHDVSAKNLAGPVGITHILSIAAENGLGKLIYLMAMISVNLGLLNLLPFPILDGGHLLFLVIEKVKGSPVDVRVQEWATSIAFFLIIFLALFVTFHDVRRLIFW